MQDTGSSGSNSNGGDGNTSVTPKRVSPAKNWGFTWNNYPEDWKEVLVPKFQKRCIGYAMGMEVAPTTGTPHIQGFIEFKGKERPFSLELPKQIQWSATRKGTQGEIRERNARYCTKSEISQEFQVWGTCIVKPKAGEYRVNIELNEWELEITSLLDTKADDRTIHWYWEPDGCRGKTTFQKWVFQNYRNVVVLCGKASDMKNGVLNYIERNEEHPEIVLINIPRSQDINYLSWQGIEEIKDMFFYAPKYEGGMVCGPNPHVCIFSNEEPPDLDKVSRDRWIIKRI